jgi:subtilisin family serine protease
VSEIDRVRVAVIDSGVFADHPHVGGVAGGVAFDEEGQQHDDYLDRLGHGTAVTAAIKEKAPDAELYAVKVFDRVLGTSITNLIAAIDWAAESGMHIANLSLGTARIEHESALRDAVDRAADRGLVIVAARDDQGVRWLPGSLPRVLPVQLDWTCPRSEYRVAIDGGVIVFRASGFAREIPGVPPQRNLNGVSFAVANMTGLVARAMRDSKDRSLDAVARSLLSAGSQTLG